MITRYTPPFRTAIPPQWRGACAAVAGGGPNRATAIVVARPDGGHVSCGVAHGCDFRFLPSRDGRTKSFYARSSGAPVAGALNYQPHR